jgi:hypothetical protein
MTTLVLYAYTERALSVPNLQLFQDTGMEPVADYVLIINGEECSVPLSERWHTVLRRPNHGIDFGAWQFALRTLACDQYEYLLFINDTVSGPHYVRDWLPRFQRLLSPEVPLVGLTVNPCSYRAYTTRYGQDVLPHVQSMFWLINRTGYRIIRPLFDRPAPEDKISAVCDWELGLSWAVLEAGYNISCILPAYQHDYRRRERWVEYYHLNPQAGQSFGEVWFHNAYFGRTLHPSETIFFKSNHNLEVTG